MWFKEERDDLHMLVEYKLTWAGLYSFAQAWLQPVNVFCILFFKVFLIKKIYFLFIKIIFDISTFKKFKNINLIF